MTSESLQSLSTVVMVFGLVLAGLGGAGVYFLGQLVRHDSALKASRERELSARLDALERDNEALRQRMELFDLVTHEADAPAGKTGQITPVFPSESAGKPADQPMRATVASISNASVSPAWTDGLTLDEMIESAEVRDLESPLLDQTQRDAIQAVLRNHPGATIAIHSVAGDQEGLKFAKALHDVFVEAGWNAGNVNPVAYARPPEGLCVSAETFPPPMEMTAACDALAAAGFQVSQQLDTRLAGQKTVLLVGRL